MDDKREVDYVTRSQNGADSGISTRTVIRIEARGELPRVQISPRSSAIAIRKSKFLTARTAGA